MRPDLFMDKLRQLIVNELGEYYIANEIVSIEECYKESNS